MSPVRLVSAERRYENPFREGWRSCATARDLQCFAVSGRRDETQASHISCNIPVLPPPLVERYGALQHPTAPLIGELTSYQLHFESEYWPLSSPALHLNFIAYSEYLSCSIWPELLHSSLASALTPHSKRSLLLVWSRAPALACISTK